MQSVMLEIANVYELFTIIDEESPRINARTHAHTNTHIYVRIHLLNLMYFEARLRQDRGISTIYV